MLKRLITLSATYIAPGVCRGLRLSGKPVSVAFVLLNLFFASAVCDCCKTKTEQAFTKPLSIAVDYTKQYIRAQNQLASASKSKTKHTRVMATSRGGHPASIFEWSRAIRDTAIFIQTSRKAKRVSDESRRRLTLNLYNA